MSSSNTEAADDLFASLPCAADEHFPFRLVKGGDSTGVIFYGAVRLNSFPWDGGGGRTDLHDIFGLMWAAALRATGAASSEVWLDVGMVGSPEIYSRFMFFTQPYSSALSEDESKVVGKRLAAHTAWLAHILWDAFHFGPADAVEPRWWDEPKPEWVEGLKDIVPEPDDWIWVTRQNPNWEYLVAGDNSISIVRLDPDARGALDELAPYYRPGTVTFAEHYIYSEHGLVNCVPEATIELGREILRRVDGPLGADNVVVIPVDTHCVLIGHRTVVAIAGQFDAARYNELRVEWENQSSKQSAVFRWCSMGLEHTARPLAVRSAGRSHPFRGTRARMGKGRGSVLRTRPRTRSRRALVDAAWSAGRRGALRDGSENTKDHRPGEIPQTNRGQERRAGRAGYDRATRRRRLLARGASRMVERSIQLL